MLFKSISIPNTKNKSLQKIASKNFNFTNKFQYWKVANFVILIGDNGSGKSTLINLLKTNYYWWNKVMQIHVSRQNEILHNKKNNKQDYLRINLWIEGLTYCCDFLLEDNFRIGNNFDFNKFDIRTMKLGNIHINNKTTSISLNDFSQKISFEKNTQKFVLLSSPDYFDRYIESNYYSAHNEFLVSFDKLPALNDIKNKIEQYLWKHKDFVISQEKNNSVLPKNKQVDPNFLETDFKKITNALYELTNLRVSYNKENYKLTIKEDGQNIDCDFEKLSSGQQKLLLIWFQILEIKLSNKVKDFLLFIDEIENSFYPKQQEKITTFLIDLSKELSHRNINHQFFIATHSPFVIKNFLNHNNTRIVDVEKNGENIEISDEILLDKNKLSYDEINYLYYGIVTTNYYLSLFEKLKVKICEKIKKDDMNCAEIDSWLHNNSVITKTIRVKINSKNNKDEEMYQTILVRFRHLLAHGMKNESEYKNYCIHKNDEVFKDETETNNFYKKFDDNPEELLKENIELIRKKILSL